MKSEYSPSPAGWRLLTIVVWAGCIVPGNTRAQLDTEWIQRVRLSAIDCVVFVEAKGFKKGAEQFPPTVEKGSGCVVNSEGFVLTCNHVVFKQPEDFSKITVIGRIGSKTGDEHELSIIDRHESRDLALLRLPTRDSGWQSVQRIGHTRTKGMLAIGTRVLVLGFPNSEKLGLISPDGIIFGTDNDGHRITGTPLSHGMSGGPVFDRNGVLVALVRAGYDDQINVLIPITYAKNLLDQIPPSILPIDGGRITPPPGLTRSELMSWIRYGCPSATQDEVNQLFKTYFKDN